MPNLSFLSPEFLVTSLIVVASPGTGALITVGAALSRGTRAAVVAAFGCTLGTVPHVLAAVTGLAAVLQASPFAFEAVRVAGVAYLLYMAAMALRERGPLQVDAAAAPARARDVVVHAVLANLLNPKLSIFFLAFLPQFVARDAAHPTARMLALSAVFMAMTFAVFAVYGVFAAAMRDRVLSRPGVLRWMRRGFAAAFVALGARLALAPR